MAILDGDEFANDIPGTVDQDTITGGGGDDTLRGGEGVDVAVWAGSSAGYGVSFSAGQFVVEDRDGTNGDDGLDVLEGIEVLRFAGTDFRLVAPGEFRVNTAQAGDQTDARIASLADGGFVVAWESAGQDGSGTGVYFQRYDRHGAATGAETLANVFLTGDQGAPAVTGLSTGGFVLTWTSAGQDGSETGVYARLFDASGTAVGGEFLVNETTAGQQSAPVVTAIAGGGFVVSWQSDETDGLGVRARRFDADGTPLGGEIAVNSLTAGDQYQQVLHANADGSFMIVWTSFSATASERGIFARNFDASGAATGTEVRVNADTLFLKSSPAMDVLDSGDRVIVWVSDGQDGGSRGIYMRRLAEDGSALDAGDVLVNVTTANSQRLPAVSAIEGGFVVTWVSDGQDGSGSGVYARVFASDGTPASAEFRVNGTTAGAQSTPSVARTEGGFEITWQSADQDGSGSGVYARRFDASGADAAPRLLGSNGADAIDLQGDSGALQAAGGTGDDTYHVSAANLLIEAAGSGYDRVFSTVNFTLGANFEELRLQGSANANATGNGAANSLYGNAGNNLLSGANGNDLLTGGEGNDTLDGGAGADTMRGGLGNDAYVVGTGDVVGEFAGEGTDTVTAFASFTLGANVENLVLGGTGAFNGVGNGAANQITGNNAANYVFGNSGNDTVLGARGNDTLLGGIGNDTLDGGAGTDTLRGGAGDDRFVLGADDRAFEEVGEGLDTIETAASRSIGANIENLVLTGSGRINGTGNAENNAITGNGAGNRLSGAAGDDTLSGGNGNDQLTGGEGADVLEGGAGADLLYGSLGADTLTGGTGADWFVFDAALGAGNVDLVGDFASQSDKIRLDDDVFTAFDATVATRLGALQLVQGAGVTTASDPLHRIIYDSSTGALYYDADGSGSSASAVQFAQLGSGSHPATLLATDFGIAG